MFAKLSLIFSNPSLKLNNLTVRNETSAILFLEEKYLENAVFRYNLMVIYSLWLLKFLLQEFCTKTNCWNCFLWNILAVDILLQCLQDFNYTHNLVSNQKKHVADSRKHKLYLLKQKKNSRKNHLQYFSTIFLCIQIPLGQKVFWESM